MNRKARRAKEKRRSFQGVTLCSLSLPLLWATSESSKSLSVFDTVSPPADSIRSLFYLVLGITGFIFIVVQGLILYCIWRFRRKQDAATSDEKEPPQIYGSMPIEVAWTVAPLLIVFVLFLVVIRTVRDVHKPPPPDDAERITIVAIGHQWWWEFRYLDKDGNEMFRTANELHVPASTPGGKRYYAWVELQSADVAHSFWVPRLSGKVDMIPGKKNSLWFESEQPGIYLGQCAEFCGTQHARMQLRVYVDEPAAYQQWHQNEKANAREPLQTETRERQGKDVFLKLSCVNCHTIRLEEPIVQDRPQPATGIFGPDLTHFARRDTFIAYDVNWRENDPKHNKSYLKVWLKDPNLLKDGCYMPNFKLTDPQVDQLAAYLSSLK